MNWTPETKLIHNSRGTAMKIWERQAGSGATIIELEGMLALGSENQQLESTVKKLVQDGKKKIIIDLANIGYVDSTGIGVLVGSLGHCKQGGCSIRMTGVQDRILRIMKLTRVDQILPLDASLQEAEQRLGEA